MRLDLDGITASAPPLTIDSRNWSESYPRSAITYSLSIFSISASASVMSCSCPAVNVNLSGLPRPSTLTSIFVLNPPRLLPSACENCPPFWGTPPSASVSPDYGTVYYQILHVRLINEMLAHPVPYPTITPSRESLIDAVPFPILGRQKPPLSTRPAHPHNRLDEPLAFDFLADIRVCLTSEKL